MMDCQNLWETKIREGYKPPEGGFDYDLTLLELSLEDERAGSSLLAAFLEQYEEIEDA